MAPSALQRKKEQFFASLYQLDQHSEDSEEEAFEPLKATSASKRVSSSSKISSSPPKPTPAAPSSTSISASSSKATCRKATTPPPSKRSKTSHRPLPPTRALSSSSGSSRQKGKRKPVEVVPAHEMIFRGLTFFFIPNNQDHTARRRQIDRASARGAEWARKWTSKVTHVIVFHNLDIPEPSREFPGGQLPLKIPIIRDGWMGDCFAANTMADFNRTRYHVRGMKSPFKVAEESKPEDAEPPVSTAPAQTLNVLPPKLAVNVEAAGDALDQALKVIQQLAIPDIEQFLEFGSGALSKSFEKPGSDNDPAMSENKALICMNKNDGKSVSPNFRTMIIFQEMANIYDRIRDVWRCLAYRRAITALRNQPELIRTREEAIAIKDIGASIADKIEEISTTDRLRKLDIAKADPEEQVLKVFMGIYGCGLKQARNWIAQGFRTLDDLSSKADLTPNQRVGIDHYDDFQKRIPREEVKQHAAIVKQALQSADGDLQMIVGGSFRRGNADSGDIDILITKQGAPLEVIRTIMNESVIPELTRTGFLTAELAAGYSRMDGSKWHGACVLPEASTWRRLDLLFVPSDELGAALIYFTGNDIFNRSIRFLAGTKGMRLNQHGLYRDVMRGKGRVKLTEGNLLESESEERIFEVLGVPYRPPEHRKP